jgi:hypothetical protein
MAPSSPREARPSTVARAVASRLNGARSRGPVTAAGEARSALNGTRHGLCSARFFLLPDEDPEAYAAFLAGMLGSLAPGDEAERQAAERAAQAMWRESRADRLEAEILADVFAARGLEDRAAAQAALQAAMRMLAVLIRYRGRIERDRDRALEAFHALRRRPRPAGAAPPLAPQSEPEPPAAVAGTSEPEPAPPPPLLRPVPAVRGTREPEPAPRLSRRERRRRAALERQAQRRAA